MVKKSFLFFIVFLILIHNRVFARELSGTNTEILLKSESNEARWTEIEKLVVMTMEKSKVPGASIVIVNKDETYNFNYDNRDLPEESEINESTLFELGSMSKAFTALAILQLEQCGKLSLDDPVTKYIPWLTVHYKGKHDGEYVDEDMELVLSNFLYHTSGIPFKTIGLIPAGDSDQMLETTVRILENIELDFYPGSKYQYVTINYDVLGLVIQEVTGVSYEEYIKQEILEPLGLYNTHLFKTEQEVREKVIQGYKIKFFKAEPYTAPFYRGNAPAGYIVSNNKDMERWMRIQLGIEEVPPLFQELVEKSHIGNTTVPSQECYYAAGWEVNVSKEKIGHGGSNPNYSSMLIMKPEIGMGVCVLTNMNSSAAEYLADNILNILQGKAVTRYKRDSYRNLDIIFSLISVVLFVLGIVFLVLFIKAIIELRQKRRIFEKIKGAKVAGLLFAIPLMGYTGFCIYYLPNILMERLPWTAVNIWGSPMFQAGCIIGYVTYVIFMFFVLLTFNCPKIGEKNYIALIPLSIINGLSSALIIFTINESFNRNLEYSTELFVYFIFSLLFFVYTIKLIQGRMIVISNNLACEKRLVIIDKVIHSPYEVIEEIGQERIFSGLNNDTNEVSKIPEVTVGFISNILTLIFCLAYLFTKSVYAFIASAIVIVLNGFISILTGYLASKYWEKNRDIQDVFFRQMTDLIYGFKELVLNKLRRLEFWNALKKTSRESAEFNKSASLKFLNFEIYNTLMYNIVFGVVVFIFPIIIFDINVNELRENLFIVFYMIGPFSTLAASISQITQLRVNLRRIRILINDLEILAINHQEVSDHNIGQLHFQSIELDQVIYRYQTKEKSDKEGFILGPVTAEFHPGEITFIVGGNGSGKSTLGKLITGLYKPQQGNIKLNGEKTDTNTLNEYFTTVFSDFYLFSRLYGFDYQSKKVILEDYFKLMGLNEKLTVDENGNFSELRLSTGQKKRLAFIVCCLEDKPVMLFDEWAAEQDPEFRQYFYMELLPKLRESGKSIIVITHDDRYFKTADKVLKLEYGSIVEEVAACV